eukprot:3375172-Pyramimonas_sp.AAC.1
MGPAVGRGRAEIELHIDWLEFCMPYCSMLPQMEAAGQLIAQLELQRPKCDSSATQVFPEEIADD